MARGIGDVERDFHDGIKRRFAPAFEIIASRKGYFVSSRGDFVIGGKQILDASVGVGFAVGDRVKFVVVQVFQDDFNVACRQAGVQVQDMRRNGAACRLGCRMCFRFHREKVSPGAGG